MDVISLRIDNQERMVNDLNDHEISPTNYMVAFLRQRAWRLPNDTITIPNIIPDLEDSASVRPYPQILQPMSLRAPTAAQNVVAGSPTVGKS